MAEDHVLAFQRKLSTFVPFISLDGVVFGYMDDTLNVLLLKYKGIDAWALPGGFLPQTATMEEAIMDVLSNRTGLRNLFLTQFHTFSSPKRGWDCSETSVRAFRLMKSNWPDSVREEIVAWFSQRFVSTAYMALVDATKVSPIADPLSDVCTWVPVDRLPPLVLDHASMIEVALQQLRMKINYLPIGRSLLPEKFTMSDLQLLYEVLLAVKLDRGNFQRKMMKLGILTRHEKLMTGAQNKAPFLYSINDKVYEELVKNGIGFS